MTYKFIIGLALCATTTWATAQQWVKITESDSNTFFIQSGTVKFSENDSGVKVVIGNGKSVSNSTGKITGVQWYVPVVHCVQKRGKLVVTDTVGKYLSENDFIYGLGNIASAIAEIMCDVVLDTNSNSPAPPIKNRI